MHVYGTRLRPPDIGCVPKDGLKEVSFEEFTQGGRHYWGTASYDRKLTEDECEHYDMDEMKEEKCMATVNSIKATQVMAGPGLCALVAEAHVVDENGKDLYVTWQKFEGDGGTVSTESMYAFLAEHEGEPAQEFLEEYDDIEEAKEKSTYGKTFGLLYSMIDKLGEEA